MSQNDLAAFDVKAGASKTQTLTILSPVNDEPLIDEATKEPWTIELIGADAPEYRKLRHRLVNEKLRAAQRSGRVKATAESLEADSIDLLAGATKGWKHIVDSGKPVEFSPQAARDLYERYPWLAEQISEFVNNRANFLGNS